MSTLADVSRRDFLRVGAVTGAGLVLAIYLPGCSRAPAAGTSTEPPFHPNAFLRIAPDDTITVVVGYSEMGQGVATAVPMLVAEELEADWSTIKVEFAPADPAYTNPLLGMQGTGGSTTVRGAWKPMREAGAAAREMLVAAAAATWGVDPSTCRAENGAVVSSSGKRLSYGKLAAKAATLPLPKAPTLKDPKRQRLVGTPRKRLDAPAKVDGSAAFGIDTKLPGLLVAVVARCPVFGGAVAAIDDAKANAVPGVKHVVKIGSGVAVVADGYWPAKTGRDALTLVEYVRRGVGVPVGFWRSVGNSRNAFIVESFIDELAHAAHRARGRERGVRRDGEADPEAADRTGVTGGAPAPRRVSARRGGCAPDSRARACCSRA